MYSDKCRGPIIVDGHDGKIEIMLKIYYDRFMETCHNIFKTLIFSFPLLFFFFSSPFSPTFRSIFSFSKQSFAHRSHDICSPSARHSLTFRSPSACHSRAVRTVRMPSARSLWAVCASFALFACRPHCLCVVRELSAYLPPTIRELSAYLSRTVRKLYARPLRTICEVFPRPPRTVPELSARPPHTARDLSMRPPRTAHRSPSLCCSFSQNQIKKGSK